MAQFLCGSQGRRAVVRAQSAGPDRLNAIDYLVVADDTVPDSLRQQVLLVRCFFSDSVSALSGENVQITGGLRVVDPSVRWAVPLDVIDEVNNPVSSRYDSALSTEERDWFAALAGTLPTPDSRWLVVLVDDAGDFSTYTLALTTPGGDGPAGGFDLKLSQVEFSFKADCPATFDCATETSCDAAPEAAPELDYLARDFASFRQLMFDRLALTQPDDASDHPARLRTMLVELVAHAADDLAYFQDAVATEAYLGTARLRSSVRRHARLLDYAMHEGCNARAWVFVEAGSLALPTSEDALPAGTVLLTRTPDAAVVLDGDGLTRALTHSPEVFETTEPLRALVEAHNTISFHTWGEDDCCLPAGSTSVALADPDEALTLAAGDWLLLEETADPDTGLAADADPQKRHVVRITEEPVRRTDALLGTSVVEVSWAQSDATPWPLTLRAGSLEVAAARGNLVLADHGQTLADEALTLQTWGNQGGLRARLERGPLTWREAPDSSQSAAEAAAQDPRAAAPEVTLTDDAGEDWFPQRDLLNSAASAREFCVETESDGRAWIRFGDDIMGRRPTSGAAFTATYRVGNGPAGAVGAGAIAHLVHDDLTTDHVLSVRNPLPAVGALPAEPLADVRRFAPQAFRVQERAVTEADWAEVAARHPEVQRAVATLRWTGSWHTVFISVDPVGGGSLSEDLHGELLDWLSRYRLTGYDLELSGPDYVPLDIALTVCVAPDAFPEHVEARLLRVFGTGTLEDGQTAFFHPDRFSFGDPVYLSRIVARAAAVPGVRWVDTSADAENPHRFKRWARPAAYELQDGVVKMSRLEIARCDNDPSAPELGRIRFFMEGGA